MVVLVGKDGGDKGCCWFVGGAPTIVLGNIGGAIAATCGVAAGIAANGDFDMALTPPATAAAD